MSQTISRHSDTETDAPPHDIAAEKALLGCLLIDPRIMTDVAPIMRPADFHVAVHYQIFAAMEWLHRGAKIVDLSSLLGLLRERESDGIAAAELAGLVENHPAPSRWRQYADRVLELSCRRRVRHVLLDGIDSLANGQPSDALIGEVVERLESVIESRSGRTLERVTTLELLDNSPRPQFLVEGILVAGQPCVLGGSFKTMKTTIAADLAVSCAVGGNFLGYFPVPRPLRVGMISGESGRHTLAETTARIACAAGIDPRVDLHNLIWSTDVPRLTNASDVAALRQFIKGDQLDLIIVDPLYLALGGASGDASNLYAMGTALGPLAALGHEFGCTVVLVHHTSRGASRSRGFEPPELGDLSFSGPSEFARQWMLLGRRSPYQPGSGLHGVWLNVGGSAGHSGCWGVDIDEGLQNENFTGRIWDVRVRKSEEVRSEADDDRHVIRTQEREANKAVQLEADMSKLRKAMANFPKGDSISAFRDIAGLNGTRATAAMEGLVAAGEVVACEIVKGNHKRPSQGFRLASDGVPE